MPSRSTPFNALGWRGREENIRAPVKQLILAGQKVKTIQRRSLVSCQLKEGN